MVGREWQNDLGGLSNELVRCLLCLDYTKIDKHDVMSKLGLGAKPINFSGTAVNGRI